MSVSPHCRQLIENASGFHPLHGARAANQLPMTLIALDLMGAAPEALDQFYAQYSRLLAPCEGPADGAGFQPLAQIGREERYADFLGYFQRTVEAEGAAQVMREWIPRLMPGIGASSFMALTRLAYALDGGVASEVPPALAYWAAYFQPSGELGPLVEDSLPKIAAQQRLLQPQAITLDKLRDFCLDAFQEKNHPLLLNALTATHAFRLLLPYQADPLRALRYLWQAILAVVLGSGIVLEGAPNRASVALPNWRAWLLRAMNLSDPARIRLVYSCWQEFNDSADLRYPEIAVQQLRL